LGKCKYHIFCCNNLNNFGSAPQKWQLNKNLDFIIIGIIFFLELEIAEFLGAGKGGGGGRSGSRRPAVAAADLAARDLVDGVRGIATRWLAAR
jgi:hypothetical protein